MAYQFTSASSQYFTTTTTPVTAAPLTLACWFYKTNITDAGNALVSIGDSDIASDNFLLVYASALNAVRAGAQFAGGAVANATTTAGATNNTWHHACAVFDSSTSRTAYIDGGNSSTNTTPVTPSGVSRITVGAFWFGSFQQYFNGRIAEVGIWNAALTADEIASLADGMTCDKVRPQSLVFYAPLVRDLIDAKGGLTITNNNGATVANHPRVYA
jgi:hypothetical protein